MLIRNSRQVTWKKDVRLCGGFTLIEILASMTILVFLILMLTRVYTDGASAWRTGTRNVNRNMLARSVMDFMSRELSMATFDYGDNTQGEPATNFLGMAYFSNTTVGNFGLEGADEIYFVRLNKEPTAGGNDGQKRSAELVHYYVDSLDGLKNAPTNALYRFALWRDFRDPALTKEANNFWPLYLDEQNGLRWMGTKDVPANDRPRIPGTILIDNVRTFEVFAYTDADGASKADWTSWNTNKLAFLDIYLETLDDKDAEKAAMLAANLGEDDPTVVEFVERSVKRNYRRVYLYNKQGYQDKW